MGRLPLDKYAKAELCQLGRDMGILSLEEQEKRIDACREALSQQREEIKNGLQGKQKSIRTVSILSGLLTAILLL